MQARASDVNGYYSCDDKFALPDKATNRKGHERQSQYQMLELDQTSLGLKCETSSIGGAPIIRWLHDLRGTIESMKSENVAKRIVSLMLKLASVFRYMPFELWRSQSTVTPSSPTTEDGSRRSSLIPTPPTEPTMKERILPCLERIQKLEKKYEEMRNKPAEIPVEKERMLMDSLDRIKSVEFDLEKTKRVNMFSFLVCLFIEKLITHFFIGCRFYTPQ